MKDYQDIKLMKQAPRIGQMKLEELLEFDKEAKDFIANGKRGSIAHKMALDAVPIIYNRLSEIRAEVTPEPEVEAPFVHPRDQYKQKLDDIIQQMKNPRLSEEQRAQLEAQFVEANTVVKGWEKIDAKEQKVTDAQQRTEDARAANDFAYQQ